MLFLNVLFFDILITLNFVIVFDLVIMVCYVPIMEI
jgi:hypothetical protein